MSSVKDFDSKETNTWCPGCGDFGILTAIKMAFSQLNLDPHQVMVVSGIGCSGHLTDFLYTYGFNGLHGRALPLAQGIKLANHKLHVVVVGGDGDGYGIGMGHFVHAIRRNVKLTYIVHNNQVYGLTTGQASVTAMKGFVSKSSPYGTLAEPLNPLALALALNCPFVARGFAGDPKHLAGLIVQGMQFNGFAFLDVFQPCITFNKINSFDWYKERIYKVDDEKGYDVENLALAELKSRQKDKLPIGVFFKNPHSVAYELQLPQLRNNTIMEKDLSKVSVKSFMDEFC